MQASRECPFCGIELYVHKTPGQWYEELGIGFDDRYDVRHVDERVALERKCPVEGSLFDDVADAFESLNLRHERTGELDFNIDMSAIRCTACGFELPKGSPLTEIRYCFHCGAKVVE